MSGLHLSGTSLALLWFVTHPDSLIVRGFMSAVCETAGELWAWEAYHIWQHLLSTHCVDLPHAEHCLGCLSLLHFRHSRVFIMCQLILTDWKFSFAKKCWLFTVCNITLLLKAKYASDCNAAQKTHLKNPTILCAGKGTVQPWETIVSYCWKIHFTWQEFTYYCRVALLYITLKSFMASPVIQQPSRQIVKSLTLNLSIIILTFWMRLVVLIVIVVNTVNTLQHVFMWSKPFRCYQESQVQACEKLVWYKHMEIKINGLPFCLSPDNGAFP